MEDILTNLEKPEFTFYQRNVATNILQETDFSEEYFFKDLPYGRMEIKNWVFSGIRIRYTKTSFNNLYCFKNINDQKLVGLEFNLKGNYLIKHHGSEYDVRAGQHNIIYSPFIDNTFHNRNLEGETFIIQFLPDAFIKLSEDGNNVLNKFTKQLEKGQPIVMSPDSPPISIELREAIYNIINCPFTGRLKKMYLFSKALEILVLQAESFDRNEKQNSLIVTRNEDKHKIILAKQYLEENLNNPPSLSELALISGVNEYKLKRGFKEIFNNTVFGHLADYKISLAKEMLRSSDKSIKEISFELGYSSPQHFSKAFKNKFGIAPSKA